MLTAVLAFFKGGSISWKALLTGIAILGVVIGLKMGYGYISGLNTKIATLSSDLERRTGELNMARFERNIAEAQAKDLQREQAETAARLANYQIARKATEEELVKLRGELANLDLEKEFSHDAEAARARFIARSRELDRLLSETSRF